MAPVAPVARERAHAHANGVFPSRSAGDLGGGPRCDQPVRSKERDVCRNEQQGEVIRNGTHAPTHATHARTAECGGLGRLFVVGVAHL